MDERNEDVLLHLFDRVILHEVGTDPPVLLGWIEDSIIDPPAPGSLQKRMIEKEAKPTTGLKDARNFGYSLIHGIDVLEDETGHDRVE